MTKLLTKVLRQIEELPDERQDDAAHVLMMMLEHDPERNQHDQARSEHSQQHFMFLQTREFVLLQQQGPPGRSQAHGKNRASSSWTSLDQLNG